MNATARARKVRLIGGRRPKLDRPTQDKVFAAIDQLIDDHGPITLTAMRKYLALYTAREKRQHEIAKLSQELADLKKKG